MGLSFLNVLLLSGVAIATIPILLHLLMQRKPVSHQFPALRFLQVKSHLRKRRLKLRHLLLLLLRVASLCLLVFAVSRPVLRGTGWIVDQEGPVAVVCVVDTSPRMLLRQENRTRIDEVRDIAMSLLEELPPESKVAIVDTNDGGVHFSASVSVATNRVERLSVGASSVSLVTAMGDAARLLESSEMERKELYVFTDLSHGGWEQPVKADWDTLHPNISLIFIDVSATYPQDFILENLELSAERLTVGSPLTVSVITRRVGPDSARSVAVEFQDKEGNFIRRGEKPVAWKDGAEQEVRFEMNGLDPGVHQGRVLVEGGDGLPADDSIEFTVDVGPPTRILVASQEPVATTGLLFVEAVAPFPLVSAGRSGFTVTLDSLTHFENASWPDFRSIVLLDPPPLPARTWEMLHDWISKGGGLIVWLGPSAGNPADFSSSESESVLGGKIERVWRSADRSNYLAPSSLDHPVLSVFRRVGDSVPWQDFPVFRHWEFKPTSVGGDVQDEQVSPAVSFAKYRNGLPALFERMLGKGRVVIVTTPISQSADDPQAWNQLATGFEPWPFMMLANEILGYVVETPDSLNITSGEIARFRLQRHDLPTATVRTPLGDTFPVAIDQQQGSIAVSATRQPGNYRIQSGGKTGGFVKGFSASLPKSATDFSRLTDDEVPLLLGANRRIVRDAESLGRDVMNYRVGAELCNWIFLIAAVLLALDWWASNRFYAPRVGADPEAGAAEVFAESIDAMGEAESTPPPPVPSKGMIEAQVEKMPPPIPSDFGSEAEYLS
ncbi:MAG: VWA domain-containing protein [Planctomycetaceae bacterium]|nr:VWA domain-containing protein [Planctomycetaceae bacterium]